MIEQAWEILENGTKEEYGLTQIAKSRKNKLTHSQVALSVAIIVQAGRDRDHEFFETESYERLCKFCCLDPNTTLFLIERVWNYEDDNQ